MLVAVGLSVASLWARAERWYYLFPPRSDPPGLIPAIMIGYMANNVLPLRAGEIVRVYVVARRWRQGFGTTLATLIVERVLDGLVILLILALLTLLIPVPVVLQWAAITLLVLDFVGMLALCAVAFAPGVCARIIERVTTPWPTIGARAQRFLGTFARGLEGIRTRAYLAPLSAWTVIVWIIPAAVAWAMLRAMNLDLPWVAAWAVLAFVGLGISIPSAPGYVGVFHAAAAWALAIFGVSQSTSVGYALLYHATQYVPVTVVGWIFLLREHLSLGEATRVSMASGTMSES